MLKMEKVLKLCQTRPGKSIRLKDFDSAWDGDDAISKAERKKFAEQALTEDQAQLASDQDLLYASDSWSVLVIFQAMDAAGKDGTIKHVMSGGNPQGCQVFSFKNPSAEELDHNFLWRCMKALPERGRIGIFNRSYYEEVLVVKVHEELVEKQRIPGTKLNKKFWKARYEDINNFEHHLSRNGTKIVKFFLNVSKGEQRRRFLERINDSRKHWKFSGSDIAEREHWDEYMESYEEMFTRTSTPWAPWYVVPADRKWVTRALVARILAWNIESLKLKYPKVTEEQLTRIEAARRSLEKNGKAK